MIVSSTYTDPNREVNIRLDRHGLYRVNVFLAGWLTGEHVFSSRGQAFEHYLSLGGVANDAEAKG